MDIEFMIKKEQTIMYNVPNQQLVKPRVQMTLKQGTLIRLMKLSLVVEKLNIIWQAVKLKL